MLGYIFDYDIDKPNSEDMTFDGFKSQSLTMLDDLDSFELG